MNYKRQLKYIIRVTNLPCYKLFCLNTIWKRRSHWRFATGVLNFKQGLVRSSTGFHKLIFSFLLRV